VTMSSLAHSVETILNNRALEAAFRRAGVTDVSSQILRKTVATRLLRRGAAITEFPHLLGHASVKSTQNTYAALAKNERFRRTIGLLDQPVVPSFKIVRRYHRMHRSHPFIDRLIDTIGRAQGQSPNNQHSQL
jgi:hypothetical protein